MQYRKDRDIPLVPWSRHMTTFPKPTQSKTTSLNKGNSPLSDYKRRQLVLAGRLQAISESYLNSGAVATRENDENESWDSQSDPGSTSSNVKNFHGARKKLKIPTQERDTEPKNKLQKRKKRQSRDGSASRETEECVVEISRETLPFADVVTPGNCGNHCSRRQLDSYIDFMYYCCLIPNRWDKEEQDEEPKRRIALSIIHKVIFCYIGLMSTFASFSLIKYYVLQFNIDRSMNNFIDIGFFIVSGTLQLYLTYFVAFRHKEMSTTLRTRKLFDKMTNGDKVTQFGKWFPIGNGTLSIIMSAVKIMTTIETFEQMILNNSKDTAEALMVWTPDQMGNTTTITDSYGTEINWTTLALGIFGVISVFFCNVQMDCYKDLMFWIAKYNESHILAFGKNVKDCLTNKTKTGKNSSEEDDQCWEMYRQAKNVDSLLNEKLYFVLIIIHLNSFMNFSFFLTYLLTDNVNIITTFLIGYNAVKGIISYIPGQRASRENDLCRKWIQTLPCETKRFRVGETSFTREVMLHELEKEPLGLGSGKLHINNEFICTFITLVISLFCFLLNIENKTEDVTRY